MTPPFSAGQRVTFDGAEYAFVRYHKTHRGIKCILSSASETVSWVPEEALIVKHHTVLYYREFTTLRYRVYSTLHCTLLQTVHYTILQRVHYTMLYYREYNTLNCAI